MSKLGVSILFVFIGLYPLWGQHNTLTKFEESQGWELLFDGESTEKWRGYNQKTFPTKGWRVEDGELIVEKSGTEEEGFGGDIITINQYTNFELTLDFMLSDTANSGIFYLVREFEGTPIWHNAPEYQLLDDTTYYEMLGEWMHTHRTGDNYDLHAAREYYGKAVGEWNTARIVKKGNKVQHWLNENMAVSYEIGSMDWMMRLKKSKFNEYANYGKNTRGHIGLQDHGHEVRFRNIKIRRL